MARAGDRLSGRRKRADAGRSRIDPRAQAMLGELLADSDQPRMADVLARLRERCLAQGVPCPSRAAIYKFLPNAPTPRYRMDQLPEHARAALYNLDGTAEVPGPQLVFYLINHGDTRALSFAAGMPLLCLRQAERMRGFRPKSHALLRALIRAREL